MLPQVSSGVLAANPKFDVLYRDLCNNKLNADGSARLDAKAQKERETLLEDLREARVQAAKSRLLRQSLRDVSYHGSDLPDDLQELIDVMLVVLEGQIPKEDMPVVVDHVEAFKQNAQPIAMAISQQVQSDVASLGAIVDPDNPTPPDDILDKLRELNAAIAGQRTAISEARLALVSEATKVQTTHRQVLEASIRLLEQTIHGSVSRSTKAKADYLALIAEASAKKLGVQHAQLSAQAFSEDVQEALRLRHAELEREGRVLARKLDDAKAKLAEYRRDRAMAEMAREYAEIKVEMERVGNDLVRLGEEA